MTTIDQLEDDHKKFVNGSFKLGEDILGSLEPGKCQLLHAALGITGEAAELSDAIKKAVIYEKGLDMDNVVEELGDIEYFMQAIRAKLNISREMTLEANIKKLSKRYPGGVYSNTAAQERADKKEE